VIHRRVEIGLAAAAGSISGLRDDHEWDADANGVDG
jgi:hypothetical protein